MSRMILALTAGITSGFFALAGCAPQTGPPNIRYGQDQCAECRMIISEARFAAAFEKGSLRKKFDDIGCLLTALSTAGRNGGVNAWAHDFLSEEWVPAREAFYVRSDWIESPMGSGLAAFALPEDARRAAEERKGRVLKFEEIQRGGRHESHQA